MKTKIKSKAWVNILATGISALTIGSTLADELHCVKGNEINLYFYEPAFSNRANNYIVELSNGAHKQDQKVEGQNLKSTLYAQGEVKEESFTVLVFTMDSYGKKPNPYRNHYLGLLSGSKDANGKWQVKYTNTDDSGHPTSASSVKKLNCSL